MPPPEVCVIHPGALSASSWARLASHLPAGTPVKVLELETISGFWAADTELTVAELADRLRPRLAIPRERVLVGWGVGGAVADALAAPSRRVVVLDGLAPGATQAPREAELLRLFAMYAGARRGPPAGDRPGAPARRPRARAGAHPRGRQRLRRPARGHDARDRQALLRAARRARPARPRAPRRLRAVRRAADGRQGRRRASRPPARRSAGTASRPSRCSPAAAITTRCSPIPPPPRTSRCCCGAG